MNQFITNGGAKISALIESRPIIVGLRLQAGPFDEVSLASTKTSGFLINPNIPEAAMLRSMLIENLSNMETAITMSKFDAPLHTQTPTAKPEISISALDNLPNNITYTLTCTISPINLHKKLWYMGCNNCCCSTSAGYMETFTCHDCTNQGTHRSTHGLPRALLEATVEDQSGMVNGTFFSEDAETILGCAAIDMAEATTHQRGHIPLLETGFTNKEHKVYIRGTPPRCSRETNRRFILSFAFATNTHQIDNAPPPILINLSTNTTSTNTSATTAASTNHSTQNPDHSCTSVEADTCSTNTRKRKQKDTGLTIK